MIVDVLGVDGHGRVPLCSEASYDTVSSSRSITVCRRRAPMFSVRSFTWKAISAMRLHAALVELDLHAFGRHQRLVLSW